MPERSRGNISGSEDYLHLPCRIGALGGRVNPCRGHAQIIRFCRGSAERPMVRRRGGGTGDIGAALPNPVVVVYPRRRRKRRCWPATSAAALPPRGPRGARPAAATRLARSVRLICHADREQAPDGLSRIGPNACSSLALRRRTVSRPEIRRQPSLGTQVDRDLLAKVGPGELDVGRDLLGWQIAHGDLPQ
jgi:hypothetical protein